MEITVDLPLDISQSTLLDMHSVLNVFGVIQWELVRLSEQNLASDEIMALLDHVGQASQFLHDPKKSIELVKSVEQFGMDLDGQLERIQCKHQLDTHPAFRQARSNIAAIIKILGVRAQELLERIEDPGRWTRYSNFELQENLYNVFRAIERNAKGAYRIVFNVAEKEDGWYLIQLDFNSVDGVSVALPPVFVDVMRDLMANARKYTPPGGEISATLLEDETSITFTVKDSGRGIPPDEIAEVVRFGVRGSNVTDRPTRGGGFGLTKAYYVTRYFGGQMWIDSPVNNGQGTAIKIRLPRRA